LKHLSFAEAPPGSFSVTALNLSSPAASKFKREHGALLAAEKGRRSEERLAEASGDPARCPPTKIAHLFRIPAPITTALSLPTSAELSASAKSPARAGSGWLTGGEVRQALARYAEREGLLAAGTVALDPALTQLFYRQTKREKAAAGGEVHRPPESALLPELVAAAAPHLTPGYAVCAGPSVLAMGSGSPGSVELFVEKHRSTFAMRARGLETFG
jgi:hypothetical protein